MPIKRAVWGILAALAVIVSGVAPIAADEGGRSIPVFAASVSGWDAVDQAEGKPCVLLVGKPTYRARVVVIENEHHDVIATWKVTGELQTADGKLVCAVAADIPVPDAAFYQVYLDGGFIGAYAAGDFPIDESWRLVLVREGI